MVERHNRKEAELIFEEFCVENNIKWEKIPEGEKPTPDFRVDIAGQAVFVEVKQIDLDDSFSPEISSRTVGSHIRKKIEKARKQAQEASNADVPFILLVYNNIDKSQMFGTEQHDFIDAMYGERTVVFDPSENALGNSFQGRNSTLHNAKNTSFSAVGCLKKTLCRIEAIIYENYFAKYKLDYSKLPTCIKAVEIAVDDGLA